MMSSFPILVTLIAACFLVYRIEYAIRVHAIWQRRVEIDKAFYTFDEAKRNFRNGYIALSEGVLPDTTEERIDYWRLIKVWINSVSVVHVSMKEGDPYQIFSRGYPDDFKNHATSRLHSLLDVAMATMQNDLNANNIFSDSIFEDADLFNYIQLYINHHRRFYQEGSADA